MTSPLDCTRRYCMRRFCQFVRLTSLFVLLLLCLAGCTKEDTQEEPTVSLTALQYELENQSINFSSMWFYDQLEEITNVHVDFEDVKDVDWKTRISLMFASNSYKDMILRGSLDTEEYGVTQGLLVPLDEYLEEHMPNYFSRLNLDGAGNAIPSSDGKSYYVGFLLSQNINTDGHFFINRTWLDKLGLAMPTTIEELTDVLRAFRDCDPNGNGLQDEIPYQATFDDNNSGIYNVFSAWGNPMNVDFVFINDAGQVCFAPLEPGFREGVEWLHLLCEEKLLDVECITQGSNLWTVKVNRDTSGFFSYWRLSNTALNSSITEQFECMIPVSAKGWQVKLPRNSDVVEFGASLTVQNKDIEASLHWLDAQLDTETMLISQNGPVGEMLTIRDDGRYEVVYVPDANDLYSIVPVICGQFFAPASYYEQVYVPAAHRQEKSAYSQMYEEAGVLESVASYRLLNYVTPKTSEESARLAQLKAQLRTVVNSALVTFMTSGVTDESYAAFEQALLDAGAAEYTKLHQSAYDRYLDRLEGADR